MSDIEGIENEIFSSAKRCNDLFGVLVSVLSGRADLAHGSSELVLDYQKRFHSWARSLGVFAGPLESLDSQLQHKPNLHGLVLQLLRLLETNLQRGK